MNKKAPKIPEFHGTATKSMPTVKPKDPGLLDILNNVIAMQNQTESILVRIRDRVYSSQSAMDNPPTPEFQSLREAIDSLELSTAMIRNKASELEAWL